MLYVRCKLETMVGTFRQPIYRRPNVERVLDINRNNVGEHKYEVFRTVSKTKTPRVGGTKRARGG